MLSGHTTTPPSTTWATGDDGADVDGELFLRTNILAAFFLTSLLPPYYSIILSRALLVISRLLAEKQSLPSSFFSFFFSFPQRLILNFMLHNRRPAADAFYFLSSLTRQNPGGLCLRICSADFPRTVHSTVCLPPVRFFTLKHE